MAWLFSLFLLFVLVPLAELALLIQIGRVVGTLPTVALVVFTGALGAYLARRQGLAVIRQVRGEFGQGRIPAGAVMDGVIILVAAAVLLTPGVLTDLFGFLCLVPAFRRLVKGYLRDWAEGAVRRGSFTISMDPGGGVPYPDPEIRNVTPREERPDPASGPPPRLDEPGRGGGD